MHFRLRHIHFLLLIFSTLGWITPAKAQIEDWNLFVSDSGAFESRFPKDFTLKQQSLRMDANTMLFQSEVSAKVNEKGADKTYLLKLEQSLGKAFNLSQVKSILNYDTAQYKALAKKLNGELLTDQDIKVDQFYGKDFYISYKKEGKPLGLRARVLLTDISRIYMVSNGVTSNAYSYRANTFFKNITLYDKAASVPGEVAQDWASYTSPLNIFSFKAPPVGNPYIDGAPVFKKEASHEIGTYNYIDPILKQKIEYNVRSFILNGEIEVNLLRNLIAKEILNKYVPGALPDMIRIEETKLADRNIAVAKMGFEPSEKNKNQNFIALEAHYKNNIVVIQYLVGTASNVLTPLKGTVFGQMTFHPEKYKAEKTEPPTTTP